MWESVAATILVLLGPLAAQEVAKPKPASPPDPELARIGRLLEQANEQCTNKQHDAARATVREALAACLALPGLDDHADAHDLLWRLGYAAFQAQEMHTAHDAFAAVCEYRGRTLADDDADLQQVRGNLGVAKKALGDLRGALVLFEKAYAVECRTASDDDPELQRTRLNLAATKRALGDLRGALGLEEKAYAVWSQALPDDHSDLQSARQNLANTKSALGDLRGALALEEKVYAVRSQTLPEDHPALQGARNNLALTKHELGDVRGAFALFERVYAALSQTQPDDHPDLQNARTNLAITKSALGDVRGALVLEEKVYAVRSQVLPDDHPDLQSARNNLAVTKRALGDLRGALALEERAHAVWLRTLPDDHPDLQMVRGNLAWTRAALGDSDIATALARERAAAARRRLAGWALAPREIGAMALQAQPAVDQLLTFTQGFGGLAAQPGLGRDALLASQTLRGAETRTTARARRARSVDADKASKLERALREAVDEVSRVVSEAAELEQGEEARQAQRLARSERLAGAVQQKELLQRALIELAAKAGGVDTAAILVEDLAAALPERAAAAAVVGYTHSRADPEHEGRRLEEPRLAALVLDRAGAVTLCPLGARESVEDRVAELRAQIGAGRERGLAPTAGDDPLAVQRRLRQLVLDPILAAAGDIDTLWLSVDEALELVPLDALAHGDGEPLGTKVALRPLVSLFDLLEPIVIEVGDAPALLALGGLDYDAAAKDALAVVGDALAPPVEGTRSGRPDSFRVLPGSTTEVKAITSYFTRTFGSERARSLTGAEAGKAAVVADAPGATFVHLATHGYFAPQSTKSAGDRDPSPAPGLEHTASGLSPLVLCGLALSGANLPPDDLGRCAGILTAEEILSLDLSHCYLVTLSACDTSLGVRRAGQGYASLRAALQGAGARHVLTSLWKVGDEATMELMVDFYRRLWVQKKAPHAALWEAKMAVRMRGAPFRDWAGWVLTGR